MKRLSQLFSRRRRYDDISASIQAHLDEKVDELMEEGMSRAQAEKTARRDFGNVALIAQRSRETWQWPLVESFLADFKLILRRLSKSPAFATTVLLHPGYRHRRQHRGLQRAQQRHSQAAALSPIRAAGSVVAQRSRSGGLANFTSGLHLSSSMYFTFADHNRLFNRWASGPRARRTSRDWPSPKRCTLPTSPTVYSNARRRAHCGARPHCGRSGSPWRQDRHAQLWLLAAPFRRRSVRHRSQHTSRFPDPRDCRRHARGFRLVMTRTSIYWCRSPSTATIRIFAGFGYDAIARLKPGVTGRAGQR